MTDVLRFTVTAADHRGLCDAADEIINRFLGYDIDPIRDDRQPSVWRVADSRIDATTSTQTVDGVHHLFTGEVTVFITVDGRPDL